MDWLNGITGSEFNFFGLEVELWKIGTSPFAPKFNIVSKPNDWAKSVAEGKKDVESGSLTEGKKLQLEFWTAFREFVRNEDTGIKPTKPGPQHWMTISIGRTGFCLGAIASLWDSASESYDSHELRAEIAIYDKDHAKVYYAQLDQMRETIEQEFGESLCWHNPSNKRACRIFLRKSTDLHDRDAWPKQHAWLLSKLETLKKVFGDRVKRLEVSEYEPAAADIEES